MHHGITMPVDSSSTVAQTRVGPDHAPLPWAWRCRWVAAVTIFWSFVPAMGGEQERREPQAHSSRSAEKSSDKTRMLVLAASRERNRTGSTTGENAGMFRQHCARCHGMDGAGRRGRSGTDQLPDFSRSSWQHSRSDTELLVAVLEGKGSMPGFRDRLSESEARQLVHYLRTLGPLPREAGNSPPEDFERRLRDLRGELKELRTQFWKLVPPASEQ